MVHGIALMKLGNLRNWMEAANRKRVKIAEIRRLRKKKLLPGWGGQLSCHIYMGERNG
ncbi:hypothetical protein BDZ91DRAFT_717488 [Kalaharituber pfeilii]|nr:hypothetical protein BDZ91DRAFT_717488 [Kalaharituber pfeilii]